LGAVVAAVLILSQTVVIVREGEVVVPTTFGRVAGASWTSPGPRLRWPWPIQEIHRFDARAQTFESGMEQTLTRDGRPVVISLFAVWRVADPIRFLERVGGLASARRNLNGLLAHGRNTVLGRHDFEELLNTDPARLKLAAIESEIANATAREAMERYGIAIETVGIRALGLPPAILDKVFERMRAERRAVAEAQRAAGEAEAARIRAEADSLREKRLAEADAAALRLRAEGDALAAEHFRVLDADPDLALFLRKLEAFQEMLGRRSTVILGTDTPPFDLLSRPPADGGLTGAAPARAASAP